MSPGPARGASAPRKRGKRYECEDAAIAFIRLEGDIVLDLEVSFVNHACREAANELAISASRGSVVHRSVSEANGSELREIPLVPDPAAPSSSAEHFCNVLRGVEELGPTAEQGLAVLEIVEAVYRSSESGRAIDFEEGRAR